MTDYKTVNILDRFYAGEINIDEAVESLGITLDELSDLIDENPWFPPCDKIDELDEIQSEYLSEYPMKRFVLSHQSKVSITKKYDISHNTIQGNTFGIQSNVIINERICHPIISYKPSDPMSSNFDCSDILNTIKEWSCDYHESN
ncbi:hypothetical protein [Methanospirillum lacunae]|uniref:Uncharacterized protein n=1 Tax=Methanospirillum lacunae TaxID=668570 RepID=A0A2V2N659_9EURY|nr:hypothetical protein [Methanospirillum lacunae]PWR71978.1 hypothetical protein DK846_08260 [Methanospirillum lacunae]